MKALTDRETIIFGLARDGTHHAVIAERLGISVQTVKNHVRMIRAKLGITDTHTRTRAIPAPPPATPITAEEMTQYPGEDFAKPAP